MAFDRFVSPALPLPPREYNYSYFNQLVRAITTFMQINDARTGINATSLTGDILRLPTGEYTAVNGANNHNIGPSASSFVRITGPTSAFTITGVAAEARGDPNGRIMYLFNATAFNMTIANESASSDAENRILTGTGANIATAGTGTVQMIYSAPDSRWIVTSLRN